MEDKTQQKTTGKTQESYGTKPAPLFASITSQALLELNSAVWAETQVIRGCAGDCRQLPAAQKMYQGFG